MSSEVPVSPLCRTLITTALSRALSALLKLLAVERQDWDLSSDFVGLEGCGHLEAAHAGSSGQGLRRQVARIEPSQCLADPRLLSLP